MCVAKGGHHSELGKCWHAIDWECSPFDVKTDFCVLYYWLQKVDLDCFLDRFAVCIQLCGLDLPEIMENALTKAEMAGQKDLPDQKVV